MIKEKILTTLIALMIVGIVCCITITYWFGFRLMLPKKEFVFYEYNLNPIYQYCGKEEALKIVNDYLGTNYGVELVKRAKKNVQGYCNQITKQVYIRNDIVDWEFAYTFLHEAIHLKYQTSNEMWTTYKTFVLAYESDIPLLQERAKLEAMVICFNENNSHPDYECSYYIHKYLGDLSWL